MSLQLLQIHNARNLKEYSLEPHPFFNIIHGDNGVGKTTILESIYLLLRARTFRSSKYKSFINHNSESCTVFSKFSDSGTDSPHSDFSLGISRSKNNSQPSLHLNTQKINSLSMISNLVVLGLITPESFSLLDAGPSIRRKFIDWGVFHVEPEFLSLWRSYKKIISNRNFILKKFSAQYKRYANFPESVLNDLNCWSPQLIALNKQLNNFRRKQVENIKPIFLDYVSHFSQELSDSISLKYYRGWNKELNYSDYLKSKINEDLEAGTTRFGTHRSDLKITYNNHPAKEVLSRGQKKLIVICLILAQFSFLINNENCTVHNILLLDDIDSELDQNNLEILFKILDLMGTQILVTTTNKSKFHFLDHNKSKLFHVKQS